MAEMLEIVLPEHSEKQRSHICPDCDRMMIPCVVSELYKFKSREIVVSNIQAYKCSECGLEIFSHKEAEMIENALEDAVGMGNN